METDIRLPVITSGSDSQQLAQVKSYLYQLVSQLNYALTQVNTEIVQTQQTVAGATGKSGGGSATDTQNLFNELKGLIISSADIVSAYYEQISAKLEGQYVAVSDFGTYQQQVATEFTATADAISANTELIEAIDTEYLATMKGTIKAGVLSSGDYGIEIGQTNVVNGVETFNQYARFTAGKLEFFLPSSSEPVAYMSDSKLYIRNAEITQKLKLGKYVVDVLDGVKFIWAG